MRMSEIKGIIKGNYDVEDKVLGLTMISDKESGLTYGMSAQYAQSTTEENPVVDLISNYGNERSIYEIKINDINPKNATMQEMFALCCHADERGICERGDFGTFHAMKQYMVNASTNGVCCRVKGYQNFLTVKLDWDKIINFMKDEFLNAGIYHQYYDCLRQMDMLDYFYTRYYFGLDAVKNDIYVTKSSYTRDEEKVKWQSESVAEESYMLGKKSFTLEEWREFLERYDRIGDAIKALMKREEEKKI